MNFAVLRFFFIASVSLILFSVATDGYADNSENEAKLWLKDARQAASKLNYRGIVSYMKDKQIESLHVFHGVSNGVEQERLLSVNTPMREVIRTADKVTCYYPESKSISIDSKPSRQSLLLDLPDDLAELSKHYTFSLGNVEHVATRPSRLVSIIPKDDLRYGRKLWIDVETKLPLKFEWIDGQQVVEQFVFNSLSLEKSIPPEELSPSTVVDGTWKTKQHETLPAESLIWTLDGVPDGFHMISYTRLKRGANNRVIDHILLSDGISSISIYIDQLMSEIFTAQPRKIGAINSYTRKLLDKYLVTVMGEAPEKTVQLIGDGIHLQESSVK